MLFYSHAMCWVFLCNFFLQFTDYHIVADGYGGKGILLSDPSTSEIDTTLTQAQDIARSGTAVLINALIGKTDFRQGSISVWCSITHTIIVWEGYMYFHFKLMAVFTLEDEQIVWTDKSSQTKKSSDVKTGWTNFSTNKSSDIWPSVTTIFPRRFARWDEQVDDSTT